MHKRTLIGVVLLGLIVFLTSLCYTNLVVAQEKKAPYASKVFRMTEELMEQGWDNMSRFLEEYANHGKGGQLSIYNSPNIVDLVL